MVIANSRILAWVAAHKTSLCFVGGTVASVGAVVMTAFSTVKAVRKYDELKKELGRKPTRIEVVKKCWKEFIPVIGLEVTSIGLTSWAFGAELSRVAELTAAVSASEARNMKLEEQIRGMAKSPEEAEKAIQKARLESVTDEVVDVDTLKTLDPDKMVFVEEPDPSDRLPVVDSLTGGVSKRKWTKHDLEKHILEEENELIRTGSSINQEWWLRGLDLPIPPAAYEYTFGDEKGEVEFDTFRPTIVSGSRGSQPVWVIKYDNLSLVRC